MAGQIFHCLSLLILDGYVSVMVPGPVKNKGPNTKWNAKSKGSIGINELKELQHKERDVRF